MLVRVRPVIAGKSAGAIYQSQVAQRLRYVADQPFGPGIVLLAEQPNVVAELEQPLEEFLRLPYALVVVGQKPHARDEQVNFSRSRMSRREKSSERGKKP